MSPSIFAIVELSVVWTLKTAEVVSDGKPLLQLDSNAQLSPIPSHSVVGEDGVWANAGIAEAANIRYSGTFIIRNLSVKFLPDVLKKHNLFIEKEF